MGHRRLFVFSAVALVAMFVPMPGLGQLLQKSDAQLAEELRDPSSSNVRELLESIQIPLGVSLGKINAAIILKQVNKDGTQREDCDYRALLRGRRNIIAIDKFLFPKVFEFASDHYTQWQQSCAKNHEQFFQDHRLIMELDDGILSIGVIKEILNLIKDKKNTKIVRSSVEALLQQASKPHLSVEDCLSSSIEVHSSYLSDENEILVANLRNFDRAAREKLFSFCAKNMNEVFNKSMESFAESDEERNYLKSVPVSSDPLIDGRIEQWICSALAHSMKLVLFIVENIPTQDRLLRINANWLKIKDVCEIDLEGYTPTTSRGFYAYFRESKPETDEEDSLTD